MSETELKLNESGGVLHDCPECGDPGPHDYQRYDGAWEMSCRACGMQNEVK